MAETRTTSVDRRMVEHIIQAVPGDVVELVIKAHLKNKALSHGLLRALLRMDPAAVDSELFFRAIGGKIREFTAPDILDRVRALGGQFEKAQMTTVPGGETLESQHDRVIKFWTDWHWKPEEAKRLTVSPSIPSQVVYLPSFVEDSLGCTYDKTEEEGRRNVQEILDSLPKVEGLRWILGNTPTVNRVLANHLRETGVYLLPAVFTLTTDTYQSEASGLIRLFVGHFYSFRVLVDYLSPGRSSDDVGVFVLGVPE